MNARSSLPLLLLVAAVGLGGCGILKKKTDAAPSATVAATSTAPVTPPPAAPPVAETAAVAVAPALDEAAVPAPQDFEDEAFEKVTAANFKAELTRLTKEISAK
ncbi:MAG TPA: hypothetical protein VEQ59_17105 [Polyangiaceae bacterium]|nr:hypothetical protein [Polyangiaceae bacterium]